MDTKKMGREKGKRSECLAEIHAQLAMTKETYTKYKDANRPNSTFGS